MSPAVWAGAVAYLLSSLVRKLGLTWYCD